MDEYDDPGDHVFLDAYDLGDLVGYDPVREDLEFRKARLAANKRTPEYLARNKLYSRWFEMRARCTDPTSPSWPWYGARGVRICDRWAVSFRNFLADMGFPPTDQAYDIDRLDPDGDYCPENCRWLSSSENRSNHRKPGTVPAHVGLVISETKGQEAMTV